MHIKCFKVFNTISYHQNYTNLHKLESKIALIIMSPSIPHFGLFPRMVITGIYQWEFPPRVFPAQCLLFKRDNTRDVFLPSLFHFIPLFFLSPPPPFLQYILLNITSIYSFVIPPANYVCGGILFSRCPSVRPSFRPSVRPWRFGFSLISWKGNDGNSSNFADTLISIRCTFIIEN